MYSSNLEKILGIEQNCLSDDLEIFDHESSLTLDEAFQESDNELELKKEYHEQRLNLRAMEFLSKILKK